MKRFIYTLLIFLSVLVASPVLAAGEKSALDSFTEAVTKGGLITGKTLPTVEGSLSKIVNAALGLIGIATFVLIIYAGGLWITAAGNDEKVATAKKILTGCVFGLIIIFAAYILVNFVVVNLQTAVTGEAPAAAPATPPK